jgi:uncharacterized membrane protein
MRFMLGLALIALAAALVGFSRPIGGALIFAVPCAVLGAVALSGSMGGRKK